MKKDMKDNFKLLYDRVIDANNVSDLKKISNQLRSISKSIICVGSGGSGVVSEYASKVFSKKNNCITITREPRDLLYDVNTRFFNELFICSYSGKNFGVESALKSGLIKRLFTNSKDQLSDVDVITYLSSIDKEKSFISLAATLIPISILLNYYLEGVGVETLFDNILNDNYSFSLVDNNNFEIISGYDTSVAAKYLESTLVEAGLGMVVLHNKYDYCHGRTTLSYHHKRHTLVYLKASNTELDKLLLQEVANLYDNIILLESNCGDNIIDNFNLLVQSMYLTKAIAEFQRKDLSDVDYAPAVKRLYYFKGEM